MNLGGMNIRADYNIAAIVLTTALANSNAGLVGDFSQFWIRRVAGMHMIRDPYTQANDFEVNWVFGRRCDSDGVAERYELDQPERACRQTRRCCVGALRSPMAKKKRAAVKRSPSPPTPKLPREDTRQSTTPTGASLRS